MEGSNSLKSAQLALVIFITQTGVGIIMVPAVLAKEAGHDGWISVMLTGAAVLVLTMLIMGLLWRYKDKSIYDINKYIFGKYLGTLLNIIIVFYLLTTTVGGASLFNYFIRITLLQETPAWALAPFIILPSFYLVWHGLKHMGRFLFCSIVCYFIILLFIIFLYKDFRVSFILPIGEAGITSIIYSTKTCFFAFMGFEAIAFFYPYISDKRNALKWSIGAILMSTAFLGIFVLAATVTFGEHFLSIMVIPFFSLSRVYNAPIIERVDLYLTALWFIPIACSIRTYIFAAYDGMQNVFKLKKTKRLYFLFFLLILVASSLPRDFNQVIALIEGITLMGMIMVIFLVFCLLLSFIRKKGVRTN